MTEIDFNDLPIKKIFDTLNQKNKTNSISNLWDRSTYVDSKSLCKLKQSSPFLNYDTTKLTSDLIENIETHEVDWLITVFNTLFDSKNTLLVRGHNEPEYLPPSFECPARIEFAHGYFQSALHEISHWSIAGAYRRTLPDYGYWYAPDGRTASQQELFEKFEIKPQAIECLFTLMCGKKFSVSQDNLQSTNSVLKSNFKQDVYDQALTFILEPSRIPQDAELLLTAFVYLCHDNITQH